MSTSTFIHPDDEIKLGLTRVIEKMNKKGPNTSYLTDSKRIVDETKKKIEEIERAMHPLALQFLNQEMTYKQIASGNLVTHPIKIVLLELSKRIFSYVDVMQDYIELMKNQDIDSAKFVEFVAHICNLARSYGRGKLMTKEQLLSELSNEGNLSFSRKVLENIKEFVRVYDTDTGPHNTMSIVCGHLREQVVPMLEVLTKMNVSQDGHAFIQQLDLNQLISQLTEIDKLEKALKGAELRVRIDTEKRQNMIGDFGDKFVPKQAYSADEQAFVDVIGNKKITVNGGRRTKHKRSGHHAKRGHKKHSKKQHRSNKRRSRSRRH